MTRRDRREAEGPARRELWLIAALAAVVFLTGALGLIYEALWFRMLGLVFGGTTEALSVLLACFMGGLALGSHLCGRWAGGIARPLRVFALLEIGVAGYAALTPWLFGLVEQAYPALGAWGAAGRALLAAAVLVPPTMLMGAALPAALKSVERQGESARAGWLYGFNTLGGAAGVLLCAFVLIIAFGVRGALWLSAGLHAALALALLACSAFFEPAQLLALPEPSGAPSQEPAAPRVLLAVLAAAGFAAMGCEVGWTRLLTLTLGSSIYAFALVLSAVLAAAAAGSIAYPVLRGRGIGAVSVLGYGLLAAGLGALLVLPAFERLPAVFFSVFQVLRVGFWPVTAVSALLAFGVVFLPSFCLGLVFPALAELLGGGGQARGLARAFAANTAGAVLGALAAGFVLIPILATRNSLTALAWVNLLCGAAVFAFVSRSRVPRAALAAAALAGACLSLTPDWDLQLLSSGIYRDLRALAAGGSQQRWRAGLKANRLLFSREGRHGLVLVQETPQGTRHLKINGKVDASAGGSLNNDMGTQLLLGHLPMALRGQAPEKALVIGLGSGITLGAALAHPVGRVDVVEIEPAVVEASRFFEPWNRAALRDPRVRLIVDDARHHLLRDGSGERYGVVISEPSNPWITGVSNLFTREFYRLVRERLEPDGVFCQWLHPADMSAEEFAAALAALRAEFPFVSLWTAPVVSGELELNPLDTLLIARSDGPGIDLEKISAALSRPLVRRDLEAIGIASPQKLLESFVFGPQAATRLVRGVEPNSDDRPVVEFFAPRRLYEPGPRLEPSAFHAEREPIWLYLKGPGADGGVRRKLDLAAFYLRRGESSKALALLREFESDRAASRLAKRLAQRLSAKAPMPESLVRLGRLYDRVHLGHQAAELYTEALNADPEAMRYFLED